MRGVRTARGRSASKPQSARSAVCTVIRIILMHNISIDLALRDLLRLLTAQLPRDAECLLSPATRVRITSGGRYYDGCQHTHQSCFSTPLHGRPVVTNIGDQRHVGLQTKRCRRPATPQRMMSLSLLLALLRQ